MSTNAHGHTMTSEAPLSDGEFKLLCKLVIQALGNSTPTAESGNRTSKRYGTIDQWRDDSGMGRSVTYEEIGLGNIKAVKVGKRTLIDYESGWAYLARLPLAKIRLSPRVKAAQHQAEIRSESGSTHHQGKTKIPVTQPPE